MLQWQRRCIDKYVLLHGVVQIQPGMDIGGRERSHDLCLSNCVTSAGAKDTHISFCRSVLVAILPQVLISTSAKRLGEAGLLILHVLAVYASPRLTSSV
jgi:hypothetical protein